jgi:hypothetical protein
MAQPTPKRFSLVPIYLFPAGILAIDRPELIDGVQLVEMTDTIKRIIEHPSETVHP